MCATFYIKLSEIWNNQRDFKSVHFECRMVLFYTIWEKIRLLSIEFWKNVLNLQNFRSGKCYLHFCQKSCQCWKKLETKLQYIDIYLHNKNVLNYGLLLVGSGRFMIFHIEGHSTIYPYWMYGNNLKV